MQAAIESMEAAVLGITSSMNCGCHEPISWQESSKTVYWLQFIPRLYLGNVSFVIRHCTQDSLDQDAYVISASSQRSIAKIKAI